ncbi:MULTISPECIES: sigma-70 family RNA polymerase sigma factor [unclassified Pedobacter]|uniref:sigma-70 family RNA polymerase sigma factor n=1 Tax=unclassified Pedobacter TaxID=2628915 RepID=UPI001DEB4265|nr:MULTISPECIES: sigma-70 family RNA polymerase sigma factor [unclassified Pedobacter]CAH0273239.1 ECF RNA polymerase sigma factor SigM [Pedobacter sp. Bi36]CAH0298275.1 ECF RNA polymerase sigma factor SigM [Pedobacter sp. Bi126]
MQNETDKGLTAKSLHSDPISWVEKYADYLYGFAMSRLRDEDVAKDLVQDTFLAGLQRLNRFEGNSEEKTWLTAILKNKIADFYRKRSAINLKAVGIEDERQDFFDAESGHWTEKDYPRAFGLEVDNPLMMKELGNILNECLAKLPGLWFSVFSMKHMDDLASELICTELKLTAANFWVIMHRTKLNLRACLQKNWN